MRGQDVQLNINKKFLFSLFLPFPSPRCLQGAFILTISWLENLGSLRPGWMFSLKCVTNTNNNWRVTLWDTEMTFSAVWTSERSTDKCASRYFKSDGYFWFSFSSLPFLKPVVLQKVQVNPGCCWEELMSSLIPHFHDFLWVKISISGPWVSQRRAWSQLTMCQWELLFVFLQGKSKEGRTSWILSWSSSLHLDLKSLWNTQHRCHTIVTLHMV